ncbi:unnamed protein product [Rotaria magnacalcarata]|uniref:Uncharacterized protein n=1 Tax=Rotaria magnacalcarata TaxID=392030 RepID=A0A818ZTW5_9BILA|nr:unnamed protein product [Rotaria magnacalcarata]CAF3800932.1 unnamed protein product [Rotaria magnacalcarata]CAF3805288.1 unnamed protein product [Rotaria magnacalcarata]CAF3819993.1 unnamed protein product [Rotaria magnacalcarata]CAF4103300.1 unnamed protein product [Rotaria magnacalcarata]
MVILTSIQLQLMHVDASIKYNVRIKHRYILEDIMGAKHSSSKCTSTTIDYIRAKDVNKLTRQLSKRTTSFRSKKKLINSQEHNIQLLQLDVDDDEQHRSALHFAAIEGELISDLVSDATIIVALYEYMHTVDVTDTLGRTPLHYAAIVGNEETLISLLLCNPDMNRLSKDGTTPLHEAIIHNHADILTLLVQHNADVHILFQNYLPPLILAVYLQNRNIVELLIRLGIDPNLTDTNTGRSALHYAAYFHDNTAIFHLLLSSTIHHIIDINIQDNNGFSVLDYARANIHRSTAIVNLLLQLNVFDPYRGEKSDEHIEIDIPTIKLFQSSNELSLLKKKDNDTKKLAEKQSKKILHFRKKSK